MKEGRTAPVAVLAGSVALLALAHTWSFRHHATDDAYISFRYLDNWLAGHGLVYNPSEWVWGFSNFLWISLLAPCVALGADPLLAAQLLGVTATLLALAAVLLGAPAHSLRERRFNPAGAALLASSGAFVMQGVSGLETSAFTLLVVATLALHERARRSNGTGALAAPGLAAAFATLARPEGVLLFALLAGDAVLERRAAPAPLARRLLWLLAGFGPPFAVYVACMAAWYGSPWPNSIDSKVGLSVEQLRRGLHYAAVFFEHYPVFGLAALAGALRWRAAAPAERTALRAAVLFAAFPIGVGGDWMLGYRLFQPFALLASALVPLALAPLTRAVSTGRRRAATALVVLACLATAAPTLWDAHVAVATRPTLLPAAIRVGLWMRENLPAGTLLATSTAGTIPYYSRLPIVDMMGINDRTIAHRAELPVEWKGIEKGDGRYVLSRAPDYIQLGSYLGATVPLFLSDIELFASEDFHRHYEPVSISVDPETTLKLYRRRANPRTLRPGEMAEHKRVAERQLRLSAFRY